MLFIWTRENQEITYIQGMNEIIGTMYYALFPSMIHLSQEEISQLDFSKTGDMFCYLNLEDHFDADVYSIFDNLMQRSLKKLYSYHCSPNHHSNNIDKFKLNLKMLGEIKDISFMKRRIFKIFYCYLKMFDQDIHDFILEVFEPDLFLFRWILCLLNREVCLKDCVYFWDSIFAMELFEHSNLNLPEQNIYNKHELNFLDFLCVSLIANLKERMLKTDDQNIILSLLMNYPQEDIVPKTIVLNAYKIRNRIFKIMRNFK